MQRNIIQDIDNFFLSVDTHFVNMYNLYVHPKYLADIASAREQAKKLHDLFSKALNSTNRNEIYSLMNNVYHPDYQVSASAFFAPYSRHDNTIYLAFQDVIRDMREFVIFETKPEKLYASMAKWKSVSKEYNKTKELNVSDLIKNLTQNVLDFAKSNATKYVLPKDRQECQDSIVYLTTVKNRLEQISNATNLTFEQIRQIGDEVLAKAIVTSNKLFCDPDVIFGSAEEKSIKNHRILIDIINGIIKYYSEGMQNPDLILNPMNKWYDATREGLITKTIKKIQARFGQQKPQNTR